MALRFGSVISVAQQLTMLIYRRPAMPLNRVTRPIATINRNVAVYNLKCCGYCGLCKDVSCYSKDKSKADGLMSQCRACRRIIEAPKVARKNRERQHKRQIAGKHTAQEWQALLDHYNHRCLCCGSTDNIQKDHVMPLALNGTDNIDNLQPLCATCNNRKGATHIDYRS